MSLIDMSERCQRLLRHAIEPAIALLDDARFNTPQAKALMLAIAMQESRIQHRRQIGGPARGFYQFERGGGVVGVLSHPATNSHAVSACEKLLIDPTPFEVFEALPYNDLLASVFARLLLWASPKRLPTFAEGPDAAWQYYLAQWRPGKPHASTWPVFWDQAWAVVGNGRA